MTAQHLAAMHAGAARHRAEEAVRARSAVAAYRQWVQDESEAFALMAHEQSIDGDVETARSLWRSVLASMPETPADNNVAWAS